MKNLKGIGLALLGFVAWLTILHIPQIFVAYQAGAIVGEGIYGLSVFGLILIIEWALLPVLFDWGIKSWARLPVFIVGLLVLIPASRNVVKLNRNQWGERETKHDQKYIDQGASGVWIPSRLKNALIDSIWGNPTDGCYGPDNGLWSMIRKGKEQSWLSVYIWLAIRNPTNAFSITNKFMACHVPSCTLSYKGNEYLSDRDPVKEGWFYVTAKDDDTGKIYRGFRLVHQWSNGKVLNISLGNKLKPEHIHEEFEPRKEYKGATFRVQLATSTF